MSRVEEALRRAAGTGPVEVRPSGQRPPENAVRCRGASHCRRTTSFRRSPKASDRAPERGEAGGARGPSWRRRVRRCETRSIGWARKSEGKIVVDQETSPASIEQYRRLATSLHHLQVQNGLKTVMVSSALPRDGKTLTSTNLALTLSESFKRRVLLIDADLRRPSIHAVFRLTNARGLADGLRSDSARRAAAHRGLAALDRSAGGHARPQPDGGSDVGADEERAERGGEPLRLGHSRYAAGRLDFGREPACRPG